MSQPIDLVNFTRGWINGHRDELDAIPNAALAGYLDGYPEAYSAAYIAGYRAGYAHDDCDRWPVSCGADCIIYRFNSWLSVQHFNAVNEAERAERRGNLQRMREAAARVHIADCPDCSERYALENLS